MSYVTMLWALVAASALVLGVVNILVWAFDRRTYARLAFAGVAFGLIGISVAELGMMSARTPAEWGSWVRWFQVPNFVVIAGTAVFVRLYLGTGRLWLLWTLIGLRAAILLTGFAVDPNFNFDRIDSIARISFLGEEVSIVGQAVPAPRQVIATLATLLALAFIVDASVSLWRQGTADARRKALVVGGGIAMFFVVATLNTQLVVWRVLLVPTLTAPPFFIALVAMAYETSRDMLRASKLARELRESERALELAASAAGLGLWSWDAAKNDIWATDRARAMLGLDAAAPVRILELAALVPGEDVDRIREVLIQATASGMEQEVQFRVCVPGQPARWILARGRWEPADTAGTKHLRGVLRDITDARRTERELDELRRNLAHADRVGTLNQLASTLTHELRQPHTAILGNLGAAQILINTPNPDLAELREILADIRGAVTRADDVIGRLRAMMKRQPMQLAPVAVDVVVQDVISLLRRDAAARGVVLETSIGTEPLVVQGDRVDLSQVLINLIMNAMDALGDVAEPRRRVAVHGHGVDGAIEVAVADSGRGVAADARSKIFEPFFTTKDSGMGMGLFIARTIVEAHAGRLWVEDNDQGGATFRFSIPAAVPPPA
jgi:signal transduction histidine kinase